MSDLTINVFDNPTEVARNFAEHLEKQIKAQGSDSFSIALSGGSTPKLLFDILAADYRQSIPWEKVHFYWGDERCVPPHDPDSNYGMTKNHLLDHIDIPESNVHRMIAETYEIEVTRYARELSDQLPERNDLPRFDLIMLGMGEDGHTASIFPDALNLINTPEVTALATHPESGQKRVTLTGNVINNADQICFLVTGAGKKPKVTEILSEKGDWKDYPASYIKPTYGGLHWFLDSAAAPAD